MSLIKRSFIMNFRRTILFIPIFFALVNSAVVVKDGDVDQQGLYSKSDRVEILTIRNFEKKIYGQKHAVVIQFYNSYCGHCRAFAPRFKAMAEEISSWRCIVRLAVLDCSVEENNDICREFEVMAYPTLRYLHEYYVKGNSNVGEKIHVPDSNTKLKTHLITKLQDEKEAGRLAKAPSFTIDSYGSYSEVYRNVHSDVYYIFLVLESANSTVGSEIALDINDYKNVIVKRAYETSDVGKTANIKEFPAVIAINSALEATPINAISTSKQNLLNGINSFLKSKNYAFPVRDQGSTEVISNDNINEKPVTINTNLVYHSDLEKTLRTSLHTEITRFKTLKGEPLQALLAYLDVIRSSYPFRGNLKEYITELFNTLSTRSSWGGGEVYELVKSLEETHAPVYSSNNLEYLRCKGSQPKFRGYTCGLWTLFHTLTVNAAQKAGTNEGAKVLQAMHGYVKHFFGCTECSQHFQAMAARNRIFDVKENDKAVLWLWIAHNEVNLRLAGDITEDPDYPKIQYPTVTSCAECRLARGAWNLPAVYQYLQNVYGADNIQVLRQSWSSAVAPSPFSNLDIGMLSLLTKQRN